MTIKGHQEQIYRVGEHFACLMAYGDEDNLTGSEVSQYDDFLQSVRSQDCPNQYEFAHWDITDDVEDFCRCEITGLMSRCIIVKAVFFLYN